MNTFSQVHQYIDSQSNTIRDELLYGDRLVAMVYSRLRESAPFLFRLFTSQRISNLVAYWKYDLALAQRLPWPKAFASRLQVNLGECLDPVENLDTARKVFERKIRYWDCRPIDHDPGVIVSPADSRLLIGSLDERFPLFIKEKFFSYNELLGRDKANWLQAFRQGDFVIARLTPDKYHYNHMPVAGRVVDSYEIDGDCHACNPGAVVIMVTPYSKNRRTVTIINTDVTSGSGVGLVAMVEVVALMIGDIVQCYSDHYYDSPLPMSPGFFLNKGQPKSLFRPGSSTTVLLFEKGRVKFRDHLLQNLHHATAQSRFSAGFGQKLTETDVQVRSTIGERHK